MAEIHVTLRTHQNPDINMTLLTSVERKKEQEVRIIQSINQIVRINPVEAVSV